jgi:uncharacterized 2Fe-2S/4Fe-4S cluster protein (DUF4445 family)
MRGHRLTFLPQKKSGVFAAGTTLRDAALELGILIDSTCAGIGSCGKCKVEAKSGASRPSAVERTVLSKAELEKGVRLSCQAFIEDDTVCTIPDTSLSLIENIAIDGVTGHFDLEPDVQKVVLDLPKPELGSRHFLVESAVQTLAGKGVHDVHPDLSAIRSLAVAARRAWGTVTATIDGTRLLGFDEGNTADNLFGVAIDIGTTTLAAKLIDLRTDTVISVSTSSNPQSALGADVVSRIQYAVRHSGGLRKLGKLVTSRLNEMIVEMAREGGLEKRDISKITVVGNTVMQHLLLGIDPRHLGVKPYAAACVGPVTERAADIGFSAGVHAVTYSAPNLSSYVGSDITSALVAIGIRNVDGTTLVVDIGTNGEMVLTAGSRIVCCSSPAGPAWEGACISWGMRASKGAIERFEILDSEIKFRTVGEAKPVGICGSGLIDIVCSLRDLGIVNSSGRLLSGEELDEDIDLDVDSRIAGRIVVDPDGKREFVVAEIAEGQAISVSQDDIRQVQLAKAGIAAGIQTLMAALGIRPADVKQALLAGAFGNHLRGIDVVKLGLIPGVPAENIHFVGNAAMAGAEAMLRSKTARIEAESIAREIEYIEVAAEPDFEDIFIDAIAFPDLTKNTTR